MAPITEGTVDSLKDLVNKLESRVAHLEARLEGKEKPSTGASMRMILIGPPGAGSSAIDVINYQMTYVACRQGHSSPEDQGPIWLLSSGTY
jgi:hypothetical protein